MVVEEEETAIRKVLYVEEEEDVELKEDVVVLKRGCRGLKGSNGVV